MNTRRVDVGQSVMEFPVKDGTRIHCCSCHEESGLRSCTQAATWLPPESSRQQFPPLEEREASGGFS